MFTGLVQAVGTVVTTEARPWGRRLVVDSGRWPHRPAEGDSLSVSGCCLTLAGLPGGRMAFDVVPETLAKTSPGGLAVGARVNLEHAATPTTLLGGHIVQGHVDGVGQVLAVETQGEYRVRVGVPRGLMEYVTPKGSVCIDGVSLTVAGLSPGEGWLEVALIPVTLEKTTLGSLRPGDLLNLEMDAMAKTIVHWLKQWGRG
jgi:riboflavin synthase